MTSYRDVKAKIAKLEKQAEELFKKEVSAVIRTIQGLMHQYGLRPDDIAKRVSAVGSTKVSKPAVKKIKTAKPAGVPKYRDPVSGKTWTGHGKAPAWISAAIKAGKKDDYLIGKVVASEKAAVMVSAKKTGTKPMTKSVSKRVTKGAPKATPKKASAVKPSTKKQMPKKTTAKKAAVKSKSTAPVTPPPEGKSGR
jgi:DNA-binding protein H-NS